MIKKEFPIPEIQRLIQEENYSIEKLAFYFKTSRPTMSKYLKEHNIFTQRNLQKHHIDILNKESIIEEYQNGNSIKEIAIKFGVSTTPIKNILRTYDENLIRTNSESHTKYTCDIHYFDKIDSANKAYLLGFICADGYVTTRHVVGIEVARKDSDVIDFFKNEMKSNKPLISTKQKYGLRLQNEILYNKLLEYDIVPNKSLILDIGEVIRKAQISKDLIPCFLLGYYDGDGGIYKYDKENTTIQFSCSITGTYETCSYFRNFFDNIGFFTKRHQDDKNNYTYQIGGRNQVKKALNKLYNNKELPDFWYKRKYNKFLEL